MWHKALPILSGAVLLGSLFLPWYTLAGFDLSQPAWDVFTVTDVALAVLAVVIAFAAPVRVAAAWIAAVLIAGRLLQRPIPEVTELAYGGFVGLAGALSAAWPGRLRVGEAVAGVGGLVLVLSLGLEWYSFSLIDAVGPNDPDPSESVNRWIIDSSGWIVFTWLDVALTALAALFMAVPVTRWRPVAFAAAAVGWLAIVLVAARMIAPPDPITDVAAGAWIALAGAVVAWAGALLATRRREPEVG